MDSVLKARIREKQSYVYVTILDSEGKELRTKDSMMLLL
jgi:hypothetical protein